MNELNSKRKNFGSNREKLRQLQNVELNNRLIQPQEQEYNNQNSIPQQMTPLQETTNVYKTNKNNQSNYLVKGTKMMFSWLGIPTKYDDLSFYSRWWRTLDILITLSNFGTLFFCAVDYEVNYYDNRAGMNDFNAFRVYALLLSLFGVACILIRHYLKYKWANIKIVNQVKVDDAYGDNAEDEWLSEDKFVIGERRAFLQKGLFFDIILNLLLPYPKIDYQFKILEFDKDQNALVEVPYLFSDAMFFLVIVRFMFCLIRALINYSDFTNHHALKLCKEYGVKCNIRFAIKCILKTQHVKIVVVSFFVSAVILGWAIRVIERPFWTQKGRYDMDYFLIPIWYCTITMYTIGYGDFVPLTNLGKIVTMMIGLWGTFNNSLIIVCLSGLLDLSNDQFLVFVGIVKSQVAMKFIETAYLFHSQKKGGSRENEIKFKDLYASYLEFKNMRNESKSIYRSNGLLYYNMKLFKEIKKINNRLDVLDLSDNDKIPTNREKIVESKKNI